MAARSPVIAVQSATKKFRRFTAVDDVSFSVAAGEVIGFVGVNGAGKTTTINMLLGFTSPSKGKVLLFGERITPANAHRSHHRISYAAGDMELPLAMTGRQYIRFVMGQSDDNHDKRLKELTQLLGPQMNKKIGTLSRGSRQKIALVAAFVTKPDLVILDEPTSGLDPIMQDAFLKLVKAEQRRGATIFMSSHYLQEVAEVCSRVLLMKNGRIVEDLSAETLESTSGKTVRLVTEKKATPPQKDVSEVTRKNTDAGQELSFIYKGKIIDLQRWISRQAGVIDIDVSERTLEAEFRNLYRDDEARQ
jgi:ABC-2 type transport system ATP-binding protein